MRPIFSPQGNTSAVDLRRDGSPADACAVLLLIEYIQSSQRSAHFNYSVHRNDSGHKTAETTNHSARIRSPKPRSVWYKIVIIDLRLRSNNSFFRADVFCIGFFVTPHTPLNPYFSLFSTSFSFMKRRMSFAMYNLSVYLVPLTLTQLFVFI